MILHAKNVDCCYKTPYNCTILTKSGENSKQIFMMVMDASHQWISLKIMMMQVNKMACKNLDFWRKIT